MKKIQRVTIVQQAADNLREYIMSGKINIGDKILTERELCELYGVGRGTIREAMCILQANGFIHMEPGRGAFVLNTEDPRKKEVMEWFRENEVEVMDIIEVRSAIEPLAIKLAIPKATAEDDNALREIHKNTLYSIANENIVDIGKYDEAFHTYIIKCSRNKLLISINEQINEYLKVFRGNTFQIPRNVDNLIPTHTKILNAFLDRDIIHAQEFISAHIDKIMQDLVESKDYFN